MISLPGLTLATGRPNIARRILATFSSFVSQGMLPNVFPGAGAPAAYNTADASLWFFEAWRAYFDATKDVAALREVFPILSDMIDRHQRGTRYGIAVDKADGLLKAGVAGVQLTWMDAKVGDWVVTPRIGKPVEINALWYNALRVMSSFAAVLEEPDRFSAPAGAARRTFARFVRSGATRSRTRRWARSARSSTEIRRTSRAARPCRHGLSHAPSMLGACYGRPSRARHADVPDERAYAREDPGSRGQRVVPMLRFAILALGPGSCSARLRLAALARDT